MKINERTLIHIAQSPENPIDQSGWLLKLNDDKKTYQKCWCVLKENIFFYYETKVDKEPTGAIILEGYRVEIVERSNHFAFKIDFGTSQVGLKLKSYIFAAEDQTELEKWIKSISCASYDYLKMVVSELQHRLDELNMLKANEPMTTLIPGSIDKDGDIIKRNNPFNVSESEQIKETDSFFQLHEQYGQKLKNFLGKSTELESN